MDDKSTPILTLKEIQQEISILDGLPYNSPKAEVRCWRKTKTMTTLRMAIKQCKNCSVGFCERKLTQRKQK